MYSYCTAKFHSMRAILLSNIGYYESISNSIRFDKVKNIFHLQCYVGVTYANPVASIKGGPARQVSILDKIFAVDASESKDLGTR